VKTAFLPSARAAPGSHRSRPHMGSALRHRRRAALLLRIRGDQHRKRPVRAREEYRYRFQSAHRGATGWDRTYRKSPLSRARALTEFARPAQKSSARARNSGSRCIHEIAKELHRGQGSNCTVSLRISRTESRALECSIFIASGYDRLATAGSVSLCVSLDLESL